MRGHRRTLPARRVVLLSREQQGPRDQGKRVRVPRSFANCTGKLELFAVIHDGHGESDCFGAVGEREFGRGLL